MLLPFFVGEWCSRFLGAPNRETTAIAARKRKSSKLAPHIGFWNSTESRFRFETPAGARHRRRLPPFFITQLKRRVKRGSNIWLPTCFRQ